MDADSKENLEEQKPPPEIPADSSTEHIGGALDTPHVHETPTDTVRKEIPVAVNRQKVAETRTEISLPQQHEVVREEEEAMEDARLNIPESARHTTEEPKHETEQKEQTVEASPDVPTPEEMRAVMQEVKELPPEKRRSYFEGIAEIGYRTQEWKGKLFSWIYGKIEKNLTEKGKTDVEQSAVTRFVINARKSYETTTEQARESRKHIHDGELWKRTKQKGVGAATLLGNAALYSRVAGIFGAGDPIRIIGATAMAFSRYGDVVKDTVLDSAETIERGRTKDIGKAWDEAWQIYEEAKKNAAEEKREITANDLREEYMRKLPEDIKERFRANPTGESRALAQRYAAFWISRGLERFNDELFKARYKTSHNTLELRRRETEILKRHTQFLKDVDRFVDRAGKINLLAYGSKVAGRYGALTAIAVGIETSIEGGFRLDEKFNHGKALEKITGAVTGFMEEKEEAGSTSTTEPSVKEKDEIKIELREDGQLTEQSLKNQTDSITHSSDMEQINAHLGAYRQSVEDLHIETAKPGDSVWKMIERRLETEYGTNFDPNRKVYIIDAIKDQIAEHPENFGLDAGANIDHIHVGQELDLSTTVGNEAYLDALMQESGRMPTAEEAEAMQAEEVTDETPAEEAEETKVQPLAEETKGAPVKEESAQEKAAPSADEEPGTSFEARMHTETERAVLKELGLNEHVIGALDNSLLENVQPMHLSAYEIAYRDLGIGDWNDENAIANYTRQALETFSSEDKPAIREWIASYRDAMLWNASDNPSVTREYIDGRIAELEKYLDVSTLEEKEPIIAPPEAPSADLLYEEKVRRLREAGISEEDIKNLTKKDVLDLREEQMRHIIQETKKMGTVQASEASTTNDKSPDWVKETAAEKPSAPATEAPPPESEKAVVEQSPEDRTEVNKAEGAKDPIVEQAVDIGRTTIQNQELQLKKAIERLTEVQAKTENVTLRHGLDRQIWQLTVEHRVLQEIVNNPEKYSHYLPEEKTVVFEGAVRVPGRPGDSIKEFDKIFKIRVDGVIPSKK